VGHIIQSYWFVVCRAGKENKMTKRMGNMVIIEEEPETECELCHKMAETRPYGPNGCRVCFECAMKDKDATEERMDEILFGNTIRLD
jgi:hypothetical protein